MDKISISSNFKLAGVLKNKKTAHTNIVGTDIHIYVYNFRHLHWGVHRIPKETEKRVYIEKIISWYKKYAIYILHSTIDEYF